MANARMAYLCERKGLPSLDAQRATLAAAGLTAAELAEAYVDCMNRKPRPGEPAQPERDHVIGAARRGDEVWVARLGVVATVEDDALRFLAAVSDHGAVLCDATTGQRFHAPSAAQEHVSAGLRIAAAISADARAATLEKARRQRPKGKTGGKEEIAPERIEAARPLWFDHRLSEAEVEERTGIAGRTLRRRFGKRGTPAFGKALNKQRGKA